jgi:acetyl esterase/lipase
MRTPPAPLGAAGSVELIALLAGSQVRAVARRVARGPRRPAWSWRTELTAAAMRAVLMRSKRRGVHWLRAAQAAVPSRSAAARQVRFERVDADGVPAVWCQPPGDPPRRTVVYLHGGGYVIGSPETHRDLIARIALGARARVLGVDYRLAPEHRFPAASDDCLRATRWLLAGGTEPSALAIAGDSAGGALAVATLCALRDARAPLPAAAALLCPWTDPLAAGGSMDANADADFGDRELLLGWIGDYAPGEQARDPRVTVLGADLAGLPPLLVQAGGGEILLDQVEAFVARARAAGVDVRYDLTPDLFHDWHLQADLLPEGARSIDDIVDFLDSHLK